MPWQPGQSGNLKGRPKKKRADPRTTFTLHHTVYNLEEQWREDHPGYLTIDPALLTQPPHKQAEDLRQGAYHIAKRCELKLHRDLDIDAKNLWDSVRAWGVAADKVLQVAETAGLSLFVPAQLLEKFMLAVNIKPASAPPQPVVIWPIHNDSTSASE